MSLERRIIRGAFPQGIFLCRLFAQDPPHSVGEAREYVRALLAAQSRILSLLRANDCVISDHGTRFRRVRLLSERNASLARAYYRIQDRILAAVERP